MNLVVLTFYLANLDFGRKLFLTDEIIENIYPTTDLSLYSHTVLKREKNNS